MENIIDNTELEQMKEQMNLLKEKVEKEKIVNQQLLRAAMKEKVSRLNRDAIFIALLGIVAIPYCTWIFISILNMSWWFIGVTDLFFLAAIVYTYFSHKDIKAKELMDGNLIEVSKKIMRMRRMNANWLKFSIPFVIVWFAWFLFEVLGNNADEGTPFAIGGTVGGIIGGFIGTKMYYRTRNKTLDVTQQIKELTEEK
jgi:hypothetical protein